MFDTIFAISTPPGIGGIAVIRISGTDAIEVASCIFSPFDPSHKLDSRSTHTLTFGQIIVPKELNNSSEESVLDEVVVSLFRAPHSFTGQDVVEISCHGSVYIQQELLRLLSILIKCNLGRVIGFALQNQANSRVELLPMVAWI